jgi:hypothetical protein
MLLGGDGRVHDGEWEMRDGGDFAGIASGYEANGVLLPLPAPFTGESTADSLFVHFGFFQDRRFDLLPAEGVPEGADLSLIARQWTRVADDGDYVLVLPVGADGRLSGASDSEGCLWEGGFDVPDASVGIYAVELSLEDGQSGACGRLEGDGYRGLATVEGERLTLMATNGSSALSLALGLEPLPPPPDEDEDADEDDDDEDEDNDRPGRRR